MLWRVEMEYRGKNKQIGIFYKGTPKAVFALERVKIA
jgi:hypothetical protein